MDKQSIAERKFMCLNPFDFIILMHDLYPYSTYAIYYQYQPILGLKQHMTILLSPCHGLSIDSPANLLGLTT